MFCTREVWNHNMNFLQNYIDEGNAYPELFGNFEVDDLGFLPHALRIVDGHTIYQVREGATLGSVDRLALINSTELVAIDTKTFAFVYSYDNRTYSYTYTNYLETELNGYSRYEELNPWEGRYSMKGATMIVNTDEGNYGKSYTWTYSNGTIIVTNDRGETETYYKVK